MEQVIFYILSVFIIVTSIAVVTLKNPIHNALALVCNLLGVAAIFASLEAHFLATVQIIVYAGAIMVLVVFVIMLLNIKEEKDENQSSLVLISVISVGFAFFLAIGFIFYHGFNVVPDLNVLDVGTVANLGRVLFSKFVFPFEIASLLIMAAVVGSVMIAKVNKEA